MIATAPTLRLSVVVPVRNERDNIASLVEEIGAACAAIGAFEVIYVDDGSVDGSGLVLEGMRAVHSWFREIRHTQSCGQSAALRTGVRFARAPVIATLDGDGQNDPAFIPAMLAQLEAGGADLALVAGQRVGRRDTGFKRWQSRTANRIRALILQDGTRDTGCGLKLMRREVFLALPYFDAFHRFMPALVRREGYAVAYHDVTDRPRRAGQSNYGFWKRLGVGILDLAGVWWLIRRRRSLPKAEEVNGC